MSEYYSRRRFLASTAIAGSVAIAGCTGGGDGDGGSDGGDETTTEESDGDSGGDSSGSWEQTSTVEMTDSLKYEPKNIEVEAGTTVTFENVGAVGHSVTAYEDKIPDGADYWASGGFDSEQAAKDAYPSEGNVEGGESWEYTFETTGVHEYYCIPHEMSGMKGKIKVV
jgi:plastocyanin